jgi:hypothetical protein
MTKRSVGRFWAGSAPVTPEKHVGLCRVEAPSRFGLSAAEHDTRSESATAPTSPRRSLHETADGRACYAFFNRHRVILCLPNDNFFFCEQDNGIKRNNEYALKEITMVAVRVLVC